MWKEVKIEETKDLEGVFALYGIEKEAFGELSWSLEMLKGELQNENTLGLILKVNHREAGYLLVRKMGEEGELLRIAVKPSFQKRGFGKDLLRALLHKAPSYGIHRIFLEVSEKNTWALKLYQKLGFKRVGYRKNYYGLNESAYIMEYNLEEVGHDKSSY